MRKNEPKNNEERPLSFERVLMVFRRRAHARVLYYSGARRVRAPAHRKRRSYYVCARARAMTVFKKIIFS